MVPPLDVRLFRRSLPLSQRLCRHSGLPIPVSPLFSFRQAVDVLPRQTRSASSSTRWKTRQGKDVFAREAKVQGLKSRAAFKLLEMDAKYKLFKKGQTVVDLGYAPGSWSQVAVERTKPNGRVVGIDIIPAQPPKGVSTIQGNFLSPAVQASLKAFLSDPSAGRPLDDTSIIPDPPPNPLSASLPTPSPSPTSQEAPQSTPSSTLAPSDLSEPERAENLPTPPSTEKVEKTAKPSKKEKKEKKEKEKKDKEGQVVDVVLSDMSAPWDQTSGFWKRSLSDPYRRMMNTSGINFRDHAGSMDLCNAALHFSFDTLRTGGHFIAKFYQGSEDKALELRLKKLFAVVHREKPESSRSESKEAYFVALRRKAGVKREDVFGAE